MEVLVQSLLDLDVRNSQGRTPLDLSAFKGHVECVDVLINQGASILVKDFTLKRTPIHTAGTHRISHRDSVIKSFPDQDAHLFGHVARTTMSTLGMLYGLV